ncbi:MAG: helix-turn-helix domain-containing protein [Waddliaceae bacterium]
MNSHRFHPKDEEKLFAELFIRQNKKAISGAPEGVDHLIMTVLNMVAQGKDIGVAPIEGDCTTQEGADLLCVSRTFFVGLLQQGKIPYYKVGRQRRVRRKDILNYDEERRRKARNDFNEMISKNQEMGFYD